MVDQFHQIKYDLVMTFDLNKFPETILQLCDLKFAWGKFYFNFLTPINSI